jgi:hypothetical protein
MVNTKDSNPMSLCVDGRASREWGARGVLATEVVEGLGNHLFAEEGPLVLAHPKQDILAPFARMNTKVPAQGSWFAPRWDRKFIASKQIQWMHRFLPLDQVNRAVGCQQITTLLPSLGKDPFYVSRKNGHHFVVPSEADRAWLEKTYSVPTDQMSVIYPAPRRSVVLQSDFASSGERGILVVRDSVTDGFDRHVSLLRRSFPTYRFATVSLRDAEAVSPTRWLRTLRNAAACFYLVEKPLDSAVLALEALYCQVPVVYADGNRTLNEVIGHPEWHLKHFLADPSSIEQLGKSAVSLRAELEIAGFFDLDQPALEYRDLYFRLGALTNESSQNGLEGAIT